jgi:3-carboxy-cis,cis-muconate cycloisomerase
VSELWDPIFGSTEIAALTDDRSWLRTLCETEAALARACAKVGLIDAAVTAAIEAACTDLADTDLAELGRRAALDGNPVNEVVRMLRARLEPDDGAAAPVPGASEAVHLGATTQDIHDTTTMLVSRRAFATIDARLEDIATSCARLASGYRDTPMAGRTLLQQAAPTTFGAVAAGWGEGIDRARARLARVEFAVQFGGAAGTLAAVAPNGLAVRAALAAELGLVDPGVVWHTERTRIADLAAALGGVCGVVAKIGTDIVLLAQTEIGEVHELNDGRSSAMPHKQNPIAAITARASAARAPGLVATLLAAMSAELQRGAGPWHAEWLPTFDLLRATGGACTRLATSLAGLQVDPRAMLANLDRLTATGAATGTDVGHAGDIVDHFLEQHSR